MTEKKPPRRKLDDGSFLIWLVYLVFLSVYLFAPLLAYSVKGH